MCFGSAPQIPQIVYQGPSQADIDRNNAALETYRRQSMAQQEQFATALQEQINQANQQAADQRQRLEQEQQAAMSEVAAQQQGAYSVTATESKPVNAQVTTAAKPKEKMRSSLKIAPGSTAASAGTGINIGV